MAKKSNPQVSITPAPEGKATAEQSPLEALADKLDALSAEATGLNETVVAKKVGWAAKSARYQSKLRAKRFKRVGSIVADLKAKGLSAEEIVARLAAGK